MMIQDIAAFATVREAGLAKLLPSKPRIAVGMGTCGSGNGAEAVFHAFASEIDARGLAVQLAPVGCFGFCAEEPLVNVWVPGRPLLILHRSSRTTSTASWPASTAASCRRPRSSCARSRSGTTSPAT